jgi:hypothetical protein
MKLEGKVGDRSPLADGTPEALRLGQSGSLITGDGQAKYQEATRRRAVFSGSIVGQVTTVGLATTYTGLVLSNPIGSPVDLVINKAGYSFIVAFPAGAHIGLMTGYSPTNVTHTAAVTTRCQYFTGGGGGYGLLDSSATLPVAPTVNMILGSGLTGAITTAPLTNGNVDIDGSIVLPPGAYCAFYTSTISGAAGGAFSFSWEEVTRVG